MEVLKKKLKENKFWIIVGLVGCFVLFEMIFGTA